MSAHLAQIIEHLRPGCSFSLDGGTLDGLRWLCTPPPQPVTSQEVEQARLLLDVQHQATAYRASRASEYPTIGDQLDDLYKRGAFSPEMTARIKAVKDKYPKPSSV